MTWGRVSSTAAAHSSARFRMLTGISCLGPDYACANNGKMG
jgi:hypothetical protein